jgi:hypothetical protein
MAGRQLLLVGLHLNETRSSGMFLVPTVLQML